MGSMIDTGQIVVEMLSLYMLSRPLHNEVRPAMFTSLLTVILTNDRTKWLTAETLGKISYRNKVPSAVNISCEHDGIQ